MPALQIPLRQIPNADELPIKEEFSKRYRQILGENYGEFIKYSLSFINRSIRVNTLKITVEELQEKLASKWKLEQIPWCREGFWMSGERLDIGNLAEHALGYFYVQEAASMIPPVVLRPEPGNLVMDMCAAPGSKTTQMAAMMQNKGIIIANDLSADRIKALGLNLNRSGVSNALITHTEARSMKEIEFDKILVDAPCSATGTIRRNLKVLQMYNYTTVQRIASTQKGLIKKAFSILKPGGEMVYSTCSMEPEENEAVVSHLLESEKRARLKKINLDIKRSKPILEFDGKNYPDEVSKCLRIWPQDNNTEGFFVARILKD